MTDLSGELDAVLQKHNARLVRHRWSIADITDEFLKDAYQIQSHISSLHIQLRNIRAPYLSTTNGPPPRGSRRHNQSSAGNANTQYLTGSQRDAIDAESKATLRDLSSAVSRLAATEDQRREIRRQIAVQRAAKRFPLGALGRWAAGDAASRRPALTPEEQQEEDRERTTDTWREGVLWFLRKKLAGAAEVHREMMERRIGREMEKSLSALYKTKGADGPSPQARDAAGLVNGAGEGGLDASGPAAANRASITNEKQAKGAAGGSAPEDHGLTPEQLQLFAEENNAMLKHYEDSLDQVRAAERSMIEISELQTTLAQNLTVQAERIDTMVEDSQRTEENVTGGNKQLKQATERWRPAKAFFWITCGLSGFLVLWDLVI